MEGPQRRLGSHVQCPPPSSVPPELQMMVEHHLGQQQQGEEPEGATESAGTQESCPPGITDTEAESRLGTSGKAQSTFRLGRDQPRRRQALPTWEGSSRSGKLEDLALSAPLHQSLLIGTSPSHHNGNSTTRLECWLCAFTSPEA